MSSALFSPAGGALESHRKLEKVTQRTNKSDSDGIIKKVYIVFLFTDITTRFHGNR